MTKRQRKIMDKNTLRDALTNKRISPNKEVIVVDNAIDWVKKQGYLVVNPRIVVSQLMALNFYLFMIIGGRLI